ncbi:MAG: hypothetical protein CVV22_00535 [Ignavibacteriae bacterium HGW-Ignavibacteriae-1]|jgi:hypothetical protein|nr:MAG: hypothetical protein CVV22_00535 [Ignavibacteriae bacterium HGW-Ignavibacteriae-1]
MKFILSILRIFTKRAFIGALLFAIALWSYTSLNTYYTTYVDIPLSVKLPPTRAIEKELPTTISVESRGTGWNLFNLLYLNNSKRANVDLSETNIKDSLFTIGRSDFLKGIESFETVELADVIPSSLTLRTGRIGEYYVPLNSLVEITPKEGFSIVGDIKLKPDSIMIIGNDKITSQIKSWSTKVLKIEEANKPIRGIVELSDSLGEIINFNTREIQFYADVQLTLERTFYDIPIVVRGGTMPKNSVINPDKIDITVRGGLEQIKNLDAENLSVYLEFTTIAKDKSGILIPNIEFPTDVEVIQVNPPYVYHIILLRQSKLSGIN